MYFYDFVSNIYVVALLGVLLSFVLAYRINPVIIYTVRVKNLMDEPGDRSAHSTKTPTLGGVGLFAAFSLALILLGIIVGLERLELLKLLSVLAATLRSAFGYNDSIMAVEYYLDGKSPKQPEIRKGKAIRYIEDHIFYS